MFSCPAYLPRDGRRDRMNVARIIIADDDELVVDIVRSALEARGHVVGSLSNGKYVKRVAEAKRPDLVILDCSMPEVCGMQALSELRSSEQVYSLPILVLTARRGTSDQDIAMQAGADDYL